MATPGFYGGGFYPGGFFTGIPDPGDPDPPPPEPPPPEPEPGVVSTGDVNLVYHADTDELEYIDQFSPKPRRGSYRGRRRRGV